MTRAAAVAVVAAGALVVPVAVSAAVCWKAAGLGCGTLRQPGIKYHISQSYKGRRMSMGKKYI